MKSHDVQSSDVTRRKFIQGSSLAALAAVLNRPELQAQNQPTPAAEEKKPAGPTIKCGVIGLGLWGREIISNLARLPQAEVAAVCDTYPTALRRGGNLAPKATAVNDYRKILDSKEIGAVLVATPTPKHREVVVAALQAGKHVYCEAPLAHTIEDAKAIALAAQAAPRQYFQAGLQLRSDPQRNYIMPFIRNGALGKWVMVRSQWHKKQSWRQAAANPEREKEVNWRLRQATSPGLLGEIGVHQIDSARWLLNALPISVSAMGTIRGEWNDDREVADTVQAMFEFPDNVQFMYDCTMANSFDGDYELFYGGHSALMFRGNRAWLFKEVDAPLLGWEVNARKETFHKETGLVVLANATKLNAVADTPQALEALLPQNPVYYSLENFVRNSGELNAGLEDYDATFKANDTAALTKYISGLTMVPYAGYREAFISTVLALKAHEAVVKGQKITFEKSWFELG